MRTKEEIIERLNEIDTTLSDNNLIIFTILKWVLEGSQWISVDDQLPKFPGFYLVFIPKDKVYGNPDTIDMSYWDTKNYSDVPNCFSLIEDCIMPTHWMPLPPGPDGKE